MLQFMWKDIYLVGIEIIDVQHRELFRMADELMKAIERNAGAEEFQKAVEFLKQYVVYHFADEEKYQRSVSYCGIEEHKKLHSTFTNSVLALEKKLIESEYNIRVVKELAGTLTAWLIYHVADADQKIAKNLPVSQKAEQQSCIASVVTSVLDTLEKMAGLNSSEMRQSTLKSPQINGDILVDIGLKGDIDGHAYFSFTKEFAFKLIEAMTFIVPEEVDELVFSALAEISNIASGNAATALAEHGMIFDISIPSVMQNGSENGVFETVSIDTGAGGMSVSVQLTD